MKFLSVLWLTPISACNNVQDVSKLCQTHSRNGNFWLKISTTPPWGQRKLQKSAFFFSKFHVFLPLYFFLFFFFFLKKAVSTIYTQNRFILPLISENQLVELFYPFFFSFCSFFCCWRFCLFGASHPKSRWVLNTPCPHPQQSSLNSQKMQQGKYSWFKNWTIEPEVYTWHPHV